MRPLLKRTLVVFLRGDIVWRWGCFDGELSLYGHTPEEAYDRWVEEKYFPDDQNALLHPGRKVASADSEKG